ncbi:MAG: hypothetical protein CMM55_11365 [Rhodospirillaceae bacterium]|nr:hypothetical protein [Rhodospirillaceae bacterium]|tara:strand:+ start:723 stop:944 length:222 start_codon:yes stop_codon:yes gene_type:complete
MAISMTRTPLHLNEVMKAVCIVETALAVAKQPLHFLLRRYGKRLPMKTWFIISITVFAVLTLYGLYSGKLALP